MVTGSVQNLFRLQPLVDLVDGLSRPRVLQYLQLGATLRDNNLVVGAGNVEERPQRALTSVHGHPGGQVGLVKTKDDDAKQAGGQEQQFSAQAISL